MKSVEILYPKYENAVTYLQDQLKVGFIEALVETFDNLENKIVKVEEEVPTPEAVTKLEKIYQELGYQSLSSENKQTLFYLLTLAGVKRDGFDYNGQVTPKFVAMVVTLLLQKLMPNISDKVIVDPAVGSGNLLLDVLKEYPANKKKNLSVIGIDNNEDLLNVVDINTALYQQPADLFLQDNLEPWTFAGADLVLSDLPAGFYPNDQNSENFELRQKQGHSYAHELMIEQIVKNLKPNGLAIVVVPTLLLQGENANNFVTWLTKKVYLNAIVELPDELFTENNLKKTILVFQNHGDVSQPVQNVLLAKLGSPKDKAALADFNVQLDNWAQNNVG